MKWHDARTYQPEQNESVLVKGCLECGTYTYREEDHNSGFPATWSHDSYDRQFVSKYPFWATLKEVEKELDSDD